MKMKDTEKKLELLKVISSLWQNRELTDDERSSLLTNIKSDNIGGANNLLYRIRQSKSDAIKNIIDGYFDKCSSIEERREKYGRENL